MSAHIGPYYGDIAPAQVLYAKALFANTSEVPTTLAGSPVVSVYKNNTTSPSTAGVSLTVDFNSTTGLINVKVDTSADGVYYAAGNEYEIVVTTGTVNSVSVVGYVIGSFSINNRTALRPSTAGRTLAVASGGQAGLDFSNINAAGSPTTLTNITVPVTTTLTNAPSDTSGTTTLLSRIGSAITITSNKVDINDKTGFSLTSAYDPAKTASQDGDAMTLTNAGIDAILDRSNGVETGYTLRQAMRLILSTLCGKLSGAATTTVTIRDVNDTVNRVTATVDSNGNRSAVTLSD
jgi:hypothetical protein